MAELTTTPLQGRQTALYLQSKKPNSYTMKLFSALLAASLLAAALTPGASQASCGNGGGPPSNGCNASGKGSSVTDNSGNNRGNTYSGDNRNNDYSGHNRNNSGIIGHGNRVVNGGVTRNVDRSNTATGGNLTLQRGAVQGGDGGSARATGGNARATGGDVTLQRGAVQGGNSAVRNSGNATIERGAVRGGRGGDGGNATIERGAVRNNVAGGEATIERGAIRNNNDLTNRNRNEVNNANRNRNDVNNENTNRNRNDNTNSQGQGQGQAQRQGQGQGQSQSSRNRNSNRAQQGQAQSSSNRNSASQSQSSSSSSSANNNGNHQTVNFIDEREVPIAPLPTSDSVGQIGDIVVPLPNIGLGGFTSTQPNGDLDYGVSVGIRIPLGAGSFREAANELRQARADRAQFRLIQEAVWLRDKGLLNQEAHPRHWAALYGTTAAAEKFTF